jgi:small subunit ribosomal protein S17
MKEKSKQTKKKELEGAKNLAGAMTSEEIRDMNIKTHGKIFEGIVIAKFPRRVAISFERIVPVRKYERYMKMQSKVHARLTNSMESQVNIGDLVKIKECRPLSKIIHFVVTEVVRKK